MAERTVYRGKAVRWEGTALDDGTQTRVIPSKDTQSCRLTENNLDQISAAQIHSSHHICVSEKGFSGCSVFCKIQSLPPPFCSSPMVWVDPNWSKQIRVFSSPGL